MDTGRVLMQGQVVALISATEDEAKYFVILLIKMTKAKVERTREEKLWIIVNTGPSSDHKMIAQGVRQLEHRFDVVKVYD